MDNLENQPSPVPAPAGVEDMSAQLASLTSMFNSILILVLVLAGVVDLFIVRQVKNTRAELTNYRLFVAQAQTQAQHNAPAIDEFARKLVDYGRTHADFAPIMTKYGLKAPASTNAAPTGGTAAPAPKAKK